MATGFPAGQTPLETRLEEVVRAVADGAAEIDIVINRNLALTGQWQGNLFQVFHVDHMLVSFTNPSHLSVQPCMMNYASSAQRALMPT